MYNEKVKDFAVMDSFVMEDEGTPTFGPQTESEAVERLAIAKRQFSSGQYTMGTEFFAQTRNVISRYATEGL